MKAVTEFASFTLNAAIKAKAALTAEGKTPEEIQESLGQTFKLEGEKLGYFVNAIDVAGENTEGLKRIMVMTAAEGEKAPAKSKQVGDHFYIPDMHVVRQAAPAKDAKGGKGGRGGRDGGKGGGKGGDRKPKESPWGMSPEEMAAKGKKPPVPKQGF